MTGSVQVGGFSAHHITAAELRRRFVSREKSLDVSVGGGGFGRWSCKFLRFQQKDVRKTVSFWKCCERCFYMNMIENKEVMDL